jgi:DNA-binding MarR family transcriptional regulator
MCSVNALDLYVLGRALTRLAEDAMRGPGAPDVPSGLRLVLSDLGEHPDSSIGELTARTGLPQSYVSSCVARLRGRGVVETRVDPADRRRTLARTTVELQARAARAGAVAAGDALRPALGDGADVDEIIAGLERLAARLRAGGRS